MTSDSGREHILDVATRLFAEHGYDGTSTRSIAEAAGLNIATVAYHTGGKRDLYLAVMERAHQAERAALEGALAGLTPDAAGILALVDRYIDFCAAHPEITALWMHRWLSDASDIADIESRYVKPLMDAVVRAVGDAVGEDADVEYVAWTVIWCTHGFGRGGVLRGDGLRHGMEDPAALARFRANLHRLVIAGLNLDARAAL
ncbi:TetR/AcrR family transcriptional regulator [Actinomadura nitritigenes]|uniref:TetR/AcrR family transcriptional regulator n=1 Tax=Actinomadura nitritigenes TaxID=134602 RepID=A0ABS3R0C6_9ACTN|nr:TetR/AcrR family transcriptional regulator [Actinomadura nitritigenes]MBO2439699.1 TetR/AcrR family transcriptional regulator [Actinomadura nitritigenes]